MACEGQPAKRCTSANRRRDPASRGSLTIIGSAKASRFRYSMLERLVAALVWNAFLVPFFWVGLNQRGLGRALDCQLFHVHWARLLGALDSDACGPIPQWQQFPEL